MCFVSAVFDQFDPYVKAKLLERVAELDPHCEGQNTSDGCW